MGGVCTHPIGFSFLVEFVEARTQMHWRETSLVDLTFMGEDPLLRKLNKPECRASTQGFYAQTTAGTLHSYMATLALTTA